MIEALKLIIARSPAAANEAVRTIAAERINSPVAARRYLHVLQMALNDPQAEFSNAEREMLAEWVESPEAENRSFVLRVRLTEGERAHLTQMADAEQVSVSDYVRRKLFRD